MEHGKRRLCLPALLALLPVCAYPALSLAGDSDRRIRSAIQSLEARMGQKVAVTWQDKRGIKTLWGNLSVPYPGTPDQAARSFLEEHAGIFELEPSLNDLIVEGMREIRATEARDTIVRFKQVSGDLPVFNGGLEVYVKEDKGVYQVHNYYMPGLTVNPSPSLTPTRILELAKNNFIETCKIPKDKRGGWESCRGAIQFNQEPEVQLGIYEKSGHPHLAYRLLLDVQSPRSLIEFTIDANTGVILNKGERIQYLDGQGSAFDPNPVNALYPYGISPQDNNDAHSSAFSQAYEAKPLRDITTQRIGRRNYYYLTGPYAYVTDNVEPPFYFGGTSGRVRATNPSRFTFTRNRDEFEHVMVYYHIDTNQRYIQSLGFPDITNRPIVIDPHGLSGADQSHYMTWRTRLVQAIWRSEKGVSMMRKTRTSSFMSTDTPYRIARLQASMPAAILKPGLWEKDSETIGQ